MIRLGPAWVDSGRRAAQKRAGFVPRLRTVFGSCLLVSACGGGGGGTGDAPAAPPPENNLPPSAIVGQDRAVVPGTWVVLDGSDSFDADGQIVEYRWQALGHELDIVGADTATASFQVPAAGEQVSRYQFLLTVTDDAGAMHSVMLTLTAQAQEPCALFAEASPNPAASGQTVALNALVMPAGGAVTELVWQQTAGPAVGIDGAQSLGASVVMPVVELDTTLGFALSASRDGQVCTAAAVVVQVAAPLPSTSSALEFRLSWESSGVDMDLYVTGPDGEQIDFARFGPTSIGGVLLGDDQGQGDRIEIVRFPAPLVAGRYCALVNQSSAGGEQPFQLRAASGETLWAELISSLNDGESSPPLAVVVTDSGDIAAVEGCGDTPLPILD